jgi:polyhydroxyalkanoate synthesis regulator phasin
LRVREPFAGATTCALAETKVASTDSAPMADKAHAAAKSPATPAPDGAKRPPGHRAVDARDAIAELTERAQEISLEAGSTVSTAMRDVIAAAAGIAGFAVESARDLVQFMVRRGQMTPEEADKLMREAEIAHNKRPASERKRATASEIAAKERAIKRAKAAAAREREMMQHHHHVVHAAAKKSAAARKSAAKAHKKPAAKHASRPAKSSKSSSKRGKRR